jgi:glycosyltransferase involved in cell wall biosynthesis
MAEITLLYVAGQEIGYGRFGVYLAKHIAERGITVYDDEGNPDHEARDMAGQLLNTGRSIPPSPTNVMAYVSVPSHMVGYHEGQHRVFCTMWEAQDLPESFRSTFHEIDTLVVPSLHNVELFSEFHDDVQFMPLGIDPALWHYSPPPRHDKEFRFLINGRGARKGTELAFRAFRTVFRQSDQKTFHPRPVLVMKSLKGHGEFYASDTRHITGKLSPVDEASLYADAHCYLGPSRGEGFGLAPLQALAVGRPTILTGAHGHASYAHLGIPLSSKPEPADYFIYGDAGMWWEPDFDELCEKMWEVYRNYDAHALRARENAEIVARDWTWSKTTDRFLEILGDRLDRPYTGNGKWHQCERLQYRIVTAQDFKSEIMGRTLFFEQGKEYYAPADVKRILFDAGVLANECLEGVDHGLAERQVINLGKYRADHSYCPTCHQQLNSQPTKADVLYEQRLAELGE